MKNKIKYIISEDLLQENNITFEQFLANIRYHKGITYQYAFCTQKAIEQLIRL